MVIEDVHWADEATIDLLSFVGRRLGRMPALLLATYRDDELGDDHPLRVVLGNLATQRATRRMRLPRLSPEAVRALAADRDVNSGELYRVTGGNPFYVTEILAGGWPSVPPTVRDAVGARLARSSPGTRRAVEAAAVTGTRVNRKLLVSVLAGSFAAVDECVTTGILIPDGMGLRFRHELVRMAVETSIAPHRKAELHARLLAELAERGDADPALLAHHADGAGDREAVLRYAPEAGRRSSALGAHREAAAQFERALRYAMILRSGRWPDCMRGPPRNIRCLTAGKKPSAPWAPRWSCAGSLATSGESARICAGCPPRCGGCAAAASPAVLPRTPSRSFRLCRPGWSWPGPTRPSARPI